MTLGELAPISCNIGVDSSRAGLHIAKRGDFCVVCSPSYFSHGGITL